MQLNESKLLTANLTPGKFTRGAYVTYRGILISWAIGMTVECRCMFSLS